MTTGYCDILLFVTVKPFSIPKCPILYCCYIWFCDYTLLDIVTVVHPNLGQKSQSQFLCPASLHAKKQTQRWEIIKQNLIQNSAYLIYKVTSSQVLRWSYFWVGGCEKHSCASWCSDKRIFSRNNSVMWKHSTWYSLLILSPCSYKCHKSKHQWLINIIKRKSTFPKLLHLWQ